MKKQRLVKWLEAHHCFHHREGSDHEFWRSAVTGKMTAVPRHREIKYGTVRIICRHLNIPLPPEK